VLLDERWFFDDFGFEMSNATMVRSPEFGRSPRALRHQLQPRPEPDGPSRFAAMVSSHRCTQPPCTVALIWCCALTGRALEARQGPSSRAARAHASRAILVRPLPLPDASERTVRPRRLRGLMGGTLPRKLPWLRAHDKLVSVRARAEPHSTWP
jgi:hypothetical protein